MNRNKDTKAKNVAEENECGRITCELLSRQRTILMGLAMLSILFFHYTEDCYVNDVHFTGFIRVYKTYIGSAGVDLFLFLSGLGLYYAMKKNSDVIRFYKRRLVRICIPYLLVSVPMWLMYDILLNKKGLMDVVLDLTFVSFFTAGVRTYWYIGAILACYMVYPAIFALLERCRTRVGQWIVCLFLCIAVTLFAIYLSSTDAELFKRVELALLRLAPFLIGCFYGRASYEKRHGYWLWGVIAVVSIALVTQVPDVGTPIFDRYVLGAAFTSVCACAAILLDRLNKDNGIVRVVSWFGTHSLEIYLCHVTVRRFLNGIELNTCYVRYEILMLILALVSAWLLQIVVTWLLRGRKGKTESAI